AKRYMVLFAPPGSANPTVGLVCRNLHKALPMQDLQSYPQIRRLCEIALSALVITGWIGFAAGCSQPYAASVHHPSGEVEIPSKPLLSSPEQGSLHRSFDELAADHTVVNHPQPASGPARVRWSDVEQAASYACSDAEMAIVEVTREPGFVKLKLKTIEDYP